MTEGCSRDCSTLLKQQSHERKGKWQNALGTGKKEEGRAILEGGGLVGIVEIERLQEVKLLFGGKRQKRNRMGKGQARSRAACLCFVLFFKKLEGQVGHSEKRDRWWLMAGIHMEDLGEASMRTRRELTLTLRLPGSNRTQLRAHSARDLFVWTLPYIVSTATNHNQTIFYTWLHFYSLSTKTRVIFFFSCMELKHSMFIIKVINKVPLDIKNGCVSMLKKRYIVIMS